MPAWLELEQEKLWLKHPEWGNFKIDFSEKEYQRPHRGKSELIAKACGAPKGFDRVIDLSAGLGEDAVFLSRLGFHVTALERNPLIFALLQQAAREQTLANPGFQFADAKHWLEEHCQELSGQVLYFDPMFAPKKKSALPRKEMRIFREVVGDDLDAHILAECALKTAAARFVVKRPIKADPLLPNPIHQFEGSAIRYDLYTPKGTL
ncbi:MAG: class I SAM-dependent methyltransferase [Proteobacteria bacterium]|jgi:16S rRNA (guanine1516-N2)-methyltransferase|nr:class I SAM-dependent methyltransferase [Pseudomonadota bacterium]